MKLKFKTQPYQTAAVQAVLDCFKGQPPASVQATRYRIDRGRAKTGSTETIFAQDMQDGFKNADLMLTDDGLLKNIIQVQRQQNLPQSDELIKTKVSRLNLDIEMETGTGKTYCYIKTIFELDHHPGSAPAEPAAVRRVDQNQGQSAQSRHRDGNRHRQDLLLHQDHFRAEQAIWLEQVHHRCAQHRHP